MNVRRFITSLLAMLVAGPAAAAGIGDLPGDVLAAVEVDAPAERLDTVAGTTAWEGLGDLLASLGRPNRGGVCRSAWLRFRQPGQRTRSCATDCVRLPGHD